VGPSGSSAATAYRAQNRTFVATLNKSPGSGHSDSMSSLDFEFTRTEVAGGALGARDAIKVDGDFLLGGTPVDRWTAGLQVSVGGAGKLRVGIARVCLPAACW